ncbi:MAG: hypothetical protein AAF456_12220 [Planctomycetota bacterium]
MKKSLVAAVLVAILIPGFIAPSVGQETEHPESDEAILLIADFEDSNSISGKHTTHEAVVSLVEDVPIDGGRSAMQTVVDPDAGADQYFGTGFSIPATDLSEAGQIRFWIKTDFESDFSFQVASGRGGTSSFRFTTAGSSGTWKQVTAPLADFAKPQWAENEADLSRISFLQVTAVGSPPYDGATIILDQFTCGPSAGTKSFSLTKIDGRHWLVDSDGRPFFAHGITHTGNARANLDLLEFSTACRRVGFNAYGYGAPEPLRADMPYIESWNDLVPISLYRGDGTHRFVDVFDPVEQARIEKGIEANCRRSRNNPNCIGYCWTDLGTWPLENSANKNWVEFFRSLPEEAPGRIAYQQFLDSWDGNEEGRDQAFLRLTAREYFRVIGTANRKYAPDQLIFGDRLSFYTYDSDVLEEMLPWVDAIAFQPHFWGPFPEEEFEEIYELAEKPILLCDFAIRFKDGDKEVNSWNMSEDSFAAAEAYTQYVTAALESEYIIGVFWCNPVDTPRGFNLSGVKQGFFADGLGGRPGLYDAVRELNDLREEMTPDATEN